jgi:putative ABC transport system permease protein
MRVRAWWSRLRGTLRRDAALEREMEREMAFHLEMATKRNVERGMTPEAAARNARLTFGSIEAAREDARHAHRARVIENIVADVRFGVRALRRTPSFATATMLTMALGIGASTAIFTVVDAVLLRPLPVPEPDDFAYLGWVWSKGDAVPSLTAFQYQFVRERARALAAVATYRTQEAQLGTAAAAAPVRGLRVHGDFFRAIGFEPRIGRAFDASELLTGTAPVVILGDAVWRTRFGADPSIVGRAILVDGESRNVVGVMPAAFAFPPAVDHVGYLVPLAVHANPADEGHNTEVIARLRHGMTTAGRAAEMQALSQAFQTAYPGLASAKESFRIYTHRDVFAGSLRRTLWLLFGAVSLLLLIACANTATLLLVRASARQREIGVRASIGAAPGRILQQLLTEGLVLSLLSTALGVGAGALLLRGFLAAAPAALPAGLVPALDGRAFAYAVMVSAVTGLVFGLAAAIPALRLRVSAGLLSGTRGATAGGTRTREMLVFLETASAMVLLAGATLLMTSFARLISVDPGFDADRVIAVRLGRLPAGYDAARREQLVDRLLERVRRAPGVEHAAAAPNLPLERGFNFPVDTREHPELAIGAVELRFVSPDYFAVLGVPLTGRDFDGTDREGSETVAIVNETFARRFWGTASPIGRSIQIGHFKDRWVAPQLAHQTRVIGLARDVREIGLDRPPRPTVILPRAQRAGDRAPVLLVRGAASGLAGILRSEVLAEESQLVPTIEPLAAVISRSVAAPRFRTMLTATFAGAALLLAAVGIYGVIAGVVEQRRRDIGIRLSLGATGAAMVLHVVRRCLMLVTAGAAAGLLTFWLVRSSLASMLFGTSPGDPRILAVAAAVFALVAAVAAWVPARRAAQVDPAITLRFD